MSSTTVKVLDWLAVAFGRLLAALWKKEEAKVEALAIPIGGTALPLSAIAPLANAVFSTIEGGVQQKKSSEQIVADVKASIPASLIPVSEALLNVFFPGAGTIEAAVVWVIQNSGPGGVVRKVAKDSEFTPQDPRFDRGDVSNR